MAISFLWTRRTDSDFSEYWNSRFGPEDHARLAEFLLATPANWMLVIKPTELMLKLYGDKGLTILAADKTYVWTIKERGNVPLSVETCLTAIAQ